MWVRSCGRTVAENGGEGAWKSPFSSTVARGGIDCRGSVVVENLGRGAWRGNTEA